MLPRERGTIGYGPDPCEVTLNEGEQEMRQPPQAVPINRSAPSEPVAPRIRPQLSIPIHGNWCGPGHGGGPAIDPIDAVCRTHDKCYDRRGYSDCRCDRGLIARMPRAIARTNSVAAKLKGTAAAAFFASIPCVCRTQVCAPCGVKTCKKRVRYPCGVKWCKKWGVPYPCGTKKCSKTVSYPCGVKTCCGTVPVPGLGGIGPC